jgi:hypothetical protein
MSFGPSPPARSLAPASWVHAAKVISTDNEPDVGKLGADLRRRSHKEIDALAICQTSDDHDDDCEQSESPLVNVESEAVLGFNGGGTAAGLNWSASRALGMTWAISGDRLARSTVFSRLYLEDEYSEE